MFGFIVRRAQATVDNALGQLAYGLLVAVPLLVALGFATAALSLRLERMYGAEASHLIVAGLFAAAALVGWLVFTLRTTAPAPGIDAPSVDSETSAAAADTKDAPFAGFTPADRELLMTAFAVTVRFERSAAPVALPSLLRAVLRNLPLLLFVLAAAFVLTRPGASREAETAAGDAVSPSKAEPAL